MQRTVSRRATVLGSAAALLLASTMPALATTDRSAQGSLSVSPVGTYSSGVFAESATEIVAHDPRTQRLFTVNAADLRIDVLNVSDPTEPVLEFSLELPGIQSKDGSVTLDGAVPNSVAVRGTTVAVAVEHPVKTEPGWVAFFTTSGQPITAVRVGALPDMLAFTPNGRTLLVANEGEPEPNPDQPGYLADPEGSVSIIDVRGRIDRLRQSHVRTATFNAWDEGTKVLDPAVRVFGPSVDDTRRISQNLEPEYITVDASSRTAYVVLQEANAMAVLNISKGEFTDIVPFGFQDHLAPGNEMDVSDRDDAIRIENWPVWGIYQPDGAASYTWRGRTFIVTANEGDTRDWPGDEDGTGYSEESRFRGFTSDDQSVCEDSRLGQWLEGNDLDITTLEDLRENENLGRLTITTTLGLGDDGCIGDVYAFGSRSFSIWTPHGEQVFDSGSDFERITAEVNPEFFNSNHEETEFDNRSDNKGPEPEDVEIGVIRGRTYAFIGLERIGGVMVYDITNPHQVSYVDYINNRDFTVPNTLDDGSTNPAAGDLGAEGVTFIPAGQSPIRGVAMLAIANEVSGTVTLFRVDPVRSGR
jgi:hypothetical protein